MRERRAAAFVGAAFATVAAFIFSPEFFLHRGMGVGLLPLIAMIGAFAGAAVASTLTPPAAADKREGPGLAPSPVEWERAGEALGLRIVRAYKLDPGALEGEIDGVAVSVRVLDEAVVTTRLVVRGIPPALEFGAAEAPLDFTADEAFDTAVTVRAARVVALPFLDGAVRVAVRQLITRRALLGNGHLELTLKSVLRTAPEIRDALRPLTELAAALDERSRVPAEEALANIARVDICIPARCRALETLAAAYPEAALPALRAGAESPEAQLRLVAGIGLGVEGEGALASVLEATTAPLKLRLEALDALVAQGMTAPLLSLLQQDGAAPEALRAKAAAALGAAGFSPGELTIAPAQGGELSVPQPGGELTESAPQKPRKQPT